MVCESAKRQLKLELLFTDNGIEIKIDLKTIRHNCVCLLKKMEKEGIVPSLGLFARFAVSESTVSSTTGMIVSVLAK